MEVKIPAIGCDMFESLGLEEWTPQAASVVLGLLLGLVFGVLAQISRFCLRRGLVGSGVDRADALGVWLVALAVAVFGTQILVSLDVLAFDEHRFMSGNVAVGAIIAGGLLFGAGMVLSRGCASRMTVLAGSGNLRAVAVLLVFAVVAHATLKGVLAPLRVWVSGFSVTLENGAGLGGSGLVLAAILGMGVAAFAWRSRLGLRGLAFGVAIGALVPLGWFGTGVLLFDEFDPITLESLAFTSASSESLFWIVAGTAVAPGFGVGLLGGVVVGSLLSALVRREARIEGFTGEVSTGRYLAGGALMGFGGVLAGGCTIGAGLSGVSLLSIAPMLALVAIVIGAKLTDMALQDGAPGSVAVPAE